MLKALFYLVFLVFGLNTLALIVALIYLIVLGEWNEIGSGIVYAIGVVLVCFALGLPTMPLIAGIRYFSERKWRVPALAGEFVIVAYRQVLVAACAYLVYLHFARVGTSINTIPLLLWGYGILMAPLGHVARFEKDNKFTSIEMFLAQIAYLSLVIGYAIGAETTSLLIFLGTLIIVSTAFALAVGAKASPAGTTG